MATFGAKEVLGYSARELQLALQYLQTGPKVQLFSSQTHLAEHSLWVAIFGRAQNHHRASKANQSLVPVIDQAKA